MPQFTRGAKEVNLIFDNPDRLPETPKHFESMKRDAACLVAKDHACDDFYAHRLIPQPQLHILTPSMSIELH